MVVEGKRIVLRTVKMAVDTVAIVNQSDERTLSSKGLLSPSSSNDFRFSASSLFEEKRISLLHVA